MMVARSYHYSSPTPAKVARPAEKNSMAADNRQQPGNVGKKETTKSSGKPPKLFTPPPPTPSRPVVIPTRSRYDVRRKGRESVTRDKRQDVQIPHDPSSTPPSMAALLAMTELPGSEKHAQVDIRRRRSSVTSRKMQNAKLRDTPKPALSTSNPQSWKMLLTPPEEPEMESGSLESDTTLGPLASFRSISTESMPSLDTDSESLSSVSNPATPDMVIGTRMGSDRRQKSISTSVGEDCALDHPLLLSIPPKTVKDDTQHEPHNSSSPPPAPLPRSRTSFKSNLTASFRKIRSAAQSFSAFTAPPTLREDYLASTLLSMDSQYPDEKRPLPLSEPPDPALRRYLNPTIFSPTELHFHSDEARLSKPSSCTVSIQLQTYQRRNRDFGKASPPPIFTSAQQKALDAVDGLPQASSPRQREPRENSDFLRVIVLEMNMRRKGKLSDASPGRARLWLPARQAGRLSEECADEGTKVPARWVGWQA